MIQQHLQKSLQDPDLINDKSGQKYGGLKTGIKAGLEKINIHLEKALVGDYPLLGAGESVFVFEMGIIFDAATQFCTRLFVCHTLKT